MTATTRPDHPGGCPQHRGLPWRKHRGRHWRARRQRRKLRSHLHTTRPQSRQSPRRRCPNSLGPWWPLSLRVAGQAPSQMRTVASSRFSFAVLPPSGSLQRQQPRAGPGRGLPGGLTGLLTQRRRSPFNNTCRTRRSRWRTRTSCCRPFLPRNEELWPTRCLTRRPWRRSAPCCAVAAPAMSSRMCQAALQLERRRGICGALWCRSLPRTARRLRMSHQWSSAAARRRRRGALILRTRALPS